MRCSRVLAGVVLALAAAPLAALEIDLDPPTPKAGEPVWIEIPEAGTIPAGARLTVEHRPASRVSHSEEIPRAGLDVRLPWRFERAGLVRLRLVDGASGDVLAQRDFAVRYDRAPLGGLVVLILAGTSLASGIALGFRNSGRAT